jgi:hypothetical protein
MDEISVLAAANSEGLLVYRLVSSSSTGVYCAVKGRGNVWTWSYTVTIARRYGASVVLIRLHDVL